VSPLFLNTLIFIELSDGIRGRFLEYLLDRPDVQKAWRAHTEHKFVEGLADGTLPVDAFKYYLIQDYLYLVRFSDSVRL
jgi:thiaminase